MLTDAYYCYIGLSIGCIGDALARSTAHLQSHNACRGTLVSWHFGTSLNRCLILRWDICRVALGVGCSESMTLLRSPSSPDSPHWRCSKPHM